MTTPPPRTAAAARFHHARIEHFGLACSHLRGETPDCYGDADWFMQHGFEAEASPREALLREALDNLLRASIPPDSLIGADPESKVGVGGESLRQWWWGVCVPSRQRAVKALAASEPQP
jgi:hypothetical protein